MINNPQTRHRHSIRLKGYDYSQAGAYYVTLVTNRREILFGEIVDEEMQLNDFGRTVQKTWNDLAKHNPGIELNIFVVMPNHLHGIICIDKSIPLSEIVRQFKTYSARRINLQRQSTGVPVWQRNYFERVIRDEAEFKRICEYIDHNPIHWALDEENPQQSHP